MLRDSEIRGVRAARVTTIKLLRLQIRGVSFKKKQNDVNSKRHRCLAFTAQRPPGWNEEPPQNTIYMFAGTGVSGCFYPESYSDGSPSCSETQGENRNFKSTGYRFTRLQSAGHVRRHLCTSSRMPWLAQAATCTVLFQRSHQPRFGAAPYSLKR